MKRKISVVRIALSVLIAFILQAGPPASAQITLTTPICQYGGGSLLSEAVSPDGTLMVSGGGRGGYLWNLSTTAVIGPLDYPKAFNAVAFSPDGQLIATGTANGVVILWNTATRQILRSFTGYPGGIRALEFSPDGFTILASSQNMVIQRNIITGNIIQTLTNGNDGVSAMDLSLDGTWVLTGGVGGTVALWDVTSGNKLRDLTRHTDNVCQVKISPDKTKALTVSNDNSAVLWNLTNGAVIHIYSYSNDVAECDFAPDGKTMLTIQSNGTMTIYYVDTLATKATLETGYWQTDYGWLAVSGVFLADGHRVLSGTTSGDILLVELNTQQPVKTYLKHTSPVFTAAFAPSGAQVLLGVQAFYAQLYDTATGANLGLYSDPDDSCGSIDSVAYSRDGSKIIAGTYQKAIMWDAVTGDVINTFEVDSEFVNGAEFSPDGTRIVTGDRDAEVIVWNAATGSALKTLNGHTDQIRCVAYSPDGTRILTGSEDHRAILWNAATGIPIRVITEHQATVLAVAFSADGTRMVTGGADNLIRLWDVPTGNLIRTFSGHQQAVEAVALSPDGKLLLSGGDDTVGILWDVATGAKLRIYDRHTDAIISVAFSPDGKYTLTASVDGTALLWPSYVPNAARDWKAYR